MRKARPYVVATLGHLQRQCGWLWLYCPRCNHQRAITLARYAIVLGVDATAEDIKRRSRCSACGYCGALTITPSWGGEKVGFTPFPG